MDLVGQSQMTLQQEFWQFQDAARRSFLLRTLILTGPLLGLSST